MVEALPSRVQLIGSFVLRYAMDPILELESYSLFQWTSHIFIPIPPDQSRTRGVRSLPIMFWEMIQGIACRYKKTASRGRCSREFRILHSWGGGMQLAFFKYPIAVDDDPSSNPCINHY